MKKKISAFTTEEAKMVLAEVHENTVEVLELADYSLSAIRGCNAYNEKRGNGKDLSEIEEEIRRTKADAVATYGLFETAFAQAELADGKLEEVKSSPKSVTTENIVSDPIAKAEDAHEFSFVLENVRRTMEAKVKKLLERISEVDALGVDCINPYYEDVISAQVETIVGLANENLKLAKEESLYNRKDEKGDE